MKLEVGMCCRTENGTIFKIVGGNIDHWDIDITYDYLSKCEDYDYSSYAYNKNNSLFEGLVTKSSFNIIDILEVGDFLDNHCIAKIENNTCYLNDGWFINADDIEDSATFICTKEQFEQISYKLGE